METPPGGVVAAHVFAPVELREGRGAADIDVVIAGYQGDVVGRPELCKPAQCRGVFAGQRDVDEIARHRDVIGCLSLEIRDDAREHVAAMDPMALTPPIDQAGRPLAEELAPSRRRQGTEMRVREMCKHEHGSISCRGRARRVSIGWTRLAWGLAQESRSATRYRIEAQPRGPRSRLSLPRTSVGCKAQRGARPAGPEGRAERRVALMNCQ